MAEAITPPYLSPLERRVLGVLVEKAKTTPDSYPLTLNALVTGCNQKSNRDPLMNLDDVQVEETLEGLQEKGLVLKVTSTRVDRWRRALYDVWLVSKVELAILAELLLRGPQTEGELRGRAGRMEPIDDIEQLRSLLRPLTERRFVLYLTPERSRGTMVTHGFHAPEEIERLRGSPFANTEESSSAETTVRFPPPAPAPQIQPAQSEIGRLDAELNQMRSELAAVKAMVVKLQQALGIEPG